MKLAVITLILVYCLSGTNGQAVMSIDLGSEFLKIAIVKPGVPMEIVLNKESKRKTPVVVAMRNGERQFSDPALTTGVKFPKLSFRFMRDLLGKQIDDPVVDRFKQWFPYYNLVKDEATGMPIFHVDETTQYTTEELVAMILEHAKYNAEVFAESKMKDVVVTVPPYFNQAERRALIRAVQLAGFNLLQLMSDNAAVALNYGIFRRNQFSNVTQHFLFYDMGATSTTATIVAYQMVKMNVGGMLETNPQLVVKGVGFDSTLGGLEMTLRLRDHLAAEFTKVKKTSSNVYENDRAMSKLWKEAERVKQILSANTEYLSQVEGLLDDEDFKVRVTRDQFEEMCSDLYSRLMKPVSDAFKFSEVTQAEISEVILMGAGTRMPRVQATLQSYLKRDNLGKSINTDEAAALGAVYQAAHLTVGFKVKKFVVKEAAVYPIVVEFDKHVSESQTTPSKIIKRTLFAHMNPYPQKKVMTFNKHTADFSFNVAYGDLSYLSDDRRKSFNATPLYVSKLTGVQTAFDTHKDSDSKGVKAHFRMDESGILHLDKVEAVFEKTAPNDTDTSTWSKIGEAIGGLFGGAKPEGGDTQTGNITHASDANKAKEESNSSEKGEEKSAKEKDPKVEEKKAEQKKEETKKNTTSEEKDKNATKSVEPEKPKTVTVKENITIETEIKDMVDPDLTSITASKKKMADLRAKDEETLALEKARNELESFIYEMQDKLTTDSYIACSLDSERDRLTTMIKEADDWQYEQTQDTTKEVFIDKLTALRKQTEPLEMRVAEYTNRAKSISELRGMILHGRNFTSTVLNLTKLDPDIVTVTELHTLGKVINSTETWLNKTILEQEASPLHEAPILTRESMLQKGADIAREVQYLVTKIMSYKRKPPPVPKPDTNTTKTSNKTRPKKPVDKSPPTDKATKESGQTDNMKKTLEDLDNIPGIRVIRPEEFMKAGGLNDIKLDSDQSTSGKDKEDTLAEETTEAPPTDAPPTDDTTTPRSDL